jgi:hypothetical protein
MNITKYKNYSYHNTKVPITQLVITYHNTKFHQSLPYSDDLVPSELSTPVVVCSDFVRAPDQRLANQILSPKFPLPVLQKLVVIFKRGWRVNGGPVDDSDENLLLETPTCTITDFDIIRPSWQSTIAYTTLLSCPSKDTSSRKIGSPKSLRIIVATALDHSLSGIFFRWTVTQTTADLGRSGSPANFSTVTL